MSDDNPTTPTKSSEESPNAGENSQSSSSPSSSKSKEMINIIVKTSKEREQFHLANDANVKDLRQMVSERYKVEPHKVCLIFSGKILKDGDTLENHKMKDGYIVHLVIRDVTKTSTSSSGTSSTSNTTSSSSSTTGSTSRPTTESTTTNPDAAASMASMLNMFFGGTPGANNNNVGGAGTLPSAMAMGTGAAGGGANSFDLNQQMMQQMNNPELMRQVMESPFVQNLYSNPDIFRSIIAANPQIQQLIERNPELNHVLSNPEVLRQTFDMMRNPAAFQEMMRSHDRAMSNLESLPGGYNALRRMYTELQEPMLNAAQEQFGVNPFASTNSTSASMSSSSSSSSSSTNTTNTTPSNTENREPLPNPWQRSNPSSTTRPATGVGGGGGGVGGGGGGSPFNLLASNSMQQMMQQMNENPQFYNQY
ncbi:ubiquilin-1-like protein [Dermatophagoides farinae]|uniref:Ubiquilin-1-like protein n=1 Tax=Dermatophagoides farinae TaxID=6954 RepID=A0A9D4P581_DERFA|nr:ubiquilin-1-like protein [Dermatophagoides farinae]